jgi:hypothetical protein
MLLRLSSSIGYFTRSVAHALERFGVWQIHPGAIAARDTFAKMTG